jgi:hypothetical protein
LIDMGLDRIVDANVTFAPATPDTSRSHR